MLGSGPFNTALAISISGMPGAARIIRSTVMSIKSNEFVEAARATGSTHARVIFRHILPNAIAPLIVFSTLGIGGNIMAISGLSFIGLGVQPPIPEWGSILSMGRQYIRDYWPMTVFPGLFIMLTLFGFNLLGDALRDALDPKLKN
jgi:peptide/nickel transport system permease protein